MRIGTARRERHLPESVLPLVDVVCVLLIFFMIAGRIEPRDVLPLSPPTVAEVEGAPSDPGQILVTQDGRIAFEGVEVAEPALLTLVAARPAAAPPLTIKADASVEAARIVELLAKLRGAGVGRVEIIAMGAMF
jgi:biopolymer transport protein ExbD